MHSPSSHPNGPASVRRLVLHAGRGPASSWGRGTRAGALALAVILASSPAASGQPVKAEPVPSPSKAPVQPPTTIPSSNQPKIPAKQPTAPNIPGGKVNPPLKIDPAKPPAPKSDPAKGNNPASPNPGKPADPNAPAGAGGEAAGEALAPGQLALDGTPVLSDDDTITFPSFGGPVKLSALVNLMVSVLNINLTIIGDLQGEVVFNAAVPVKKADLMRLVDSLLGQSGWTITQDSSLPDWYLVVQENNVGQNFVGERATTRVFATPNVRPSAILQAVNTQLGGGGVGAAIPGQPIQPGGGGGKLQAFDELGIIIATDSVRKLATINDLITKILEEYGKAEFIRVEVTNLSASAAKDRVLQLMGQSPQGRTGFGDPNQAVQQPQRFPNQPVVGGGTGAVGTLDNITDRLTIDPSGNALIFHGVPAEIERVKAILAIIDVPNKLEPKRFTAGSMAAQVADMAQKRGMGEVTSISVDGGQNQNGQNPNGQPFPNQFQNGRGGIGGVQNNTAGSGLLGGPLLVVDEYNGNIIYYGTPTQHENLDKLIKELDIQSERIVIKEYKLKNSKAEDVADVILGLLNNQSPIGSSPLLPDGGTGGFGTGNNGGFGSGFGSSRNNNNNNNRYNSSSNRQNRSGAAGTGNVGPNGRRNPGAGGTGEGLELDATNAFVIADVKNNQILVKAPQGQQHDFRKLIETIDLRRPQVYLEVQIVAVRWSDDLRVAFETQLLNASGQGGALQTNFGLTTAGNTFTDRRNVATGLSGLTAAIIKSNQLPIVVNALQTKADTKILSNPALLVDDNEEAELMSTEEQPYTTTQVSSGAPNVNSFGGYESAGTKLHITPSISEDGYVRLNYETELSSFTSAVGVNGSPPPKLVNNVKSNSITVPSDTTVIVGGLNVDTRRVTRIQVPLLGDIPLIGHLFQDYNTSTAITTLYVFITPRIMREQNFSDLKLLTEGPQARSKLDPEIPILKPSTIDITPVQIDPAAPSHK